ncbi:MAG: hypothetical protein A3F84_26100 [Candidatus Handelsmanbacteria bacterium RIFCSPLOWO2_12_FULL_64_10]|uniref:Sialidase domain-containing protein n=1 Tax=Handelsmanbacteria sp. (strain RIFCSPLOWO2_12_FULL_64_10) TaxID=1817868 RepID=A0A1F6CAE9_HANXR|nr:MAG: hypothetical protein A3F84_26100 [Candidatus Handelsmanbacteria bacterium RIFCSPLOWO2_12_FULL_64_10]
MVLYDHPNAQSVFVGDATLLEDDTLIVPLSVTWRGPFIGYDWYEVKDALHLNLISRDRGISWQVHDGPVPEKSFQLSDGALFRVWWKGYESYPVDRQTEFEKAGHFVYPVPEQKMFSVTGGFRAGVSRDSGRTWSEWDVVLPHRASLAGYGMATAKRLSDGTILMPAFGYLSRCHKTRACLMLRSPDAGAHWDLITLAQDDRPEAVADAPLPSDSDWAALHRGILGFDEAQVIETRTPGRVIAVIEEAKTKDLYACLSEDSGRTWTRPVKTGMRGNTPLLLRLRSGTLACAYTDRYAPDPMARGLHVCYSRDDGETWDTDHLVILKDTNARPDGQCLWNLVQFSDGTLFSSGWSTKRGCGGGEEVSYAVGFRFTEDFITPLRVNRS